MKKIAEKIILVAILFSALALPAGEKTYTALKSGKEISWDKIPEASGFVNIDNTAELSSKQTFFKIIYTDSAILIKIKCQEPEINRIVVKEGGTDFTNLWNENSVELFISPCPGVNYHFVASSIGTKWSEVLSSANDTVSNDDWDLKAEKGEDFYSLEFVLPFVILGQVPQKNQAWAINIARNNYTREKEKHSSWISSRSWHDRRAYGQLLFPEKINDAEVMPLLVSRAKGKILLQKEYLDKIVQDLQVLEAELHASEKLNVFLKEYTTANKNLAELSSVKDSGKLKKEYENLIRRGTALKKEMLLQSLFIREKSI